jgi:starvation-inducible DNA-binding protein
MIEGTPQSDSDAEPEALLDLGLELTFPASDPIAVQEAFAEARTQQQRRRLDRDRLVSMQLKANSAGAQPSQERALPVAPEANSPLALALNALLADFFAIYMKTKNFHWHVSGPHFRDYHLLFDEQATQIIQTTDAIAERVRKIHGRTLHSIGHVARLQRLTDNDDEIVAPALMLGELMADNQALAAWLHDVHGICEQAGDVATASLVEVWIDDAQKRAWFLREASQNA